MRLRRRAKRRDLENAVRDLYDVGVQVADVTNPDMKAQRRRLGLLLDKYERLRHRVGEPW